MLNRALEVLKEEGPVALGTKARARLTGLMRRRRYPYTLRQEVAGQDLTLRIADHFGEAQFATTETWQELLYIRDNLLRPGGTAVDVGTNHGISAVLFSRWLGPEGHVIAYDGRPRNVEIAKLNASLNGARNVDVRFAAVSNERGTVEFVDQPNGGVAKVGLRTRTVTVPTVTLDADLAGSRVDFLKIDVEGHELEVLKGASAIMATCPALDLEIHCATFEQPEQTIAELLELVGLERYSVSWQLVKNGPLLQHDPQQMTPAHLAGLINVHLFARPLTWTQNS